MEKAPVLSSLHINPYHNRNKVTDEREFIGREEVIEEIERQILYDEPQSVSLIGERRIGKSSLLTRVFQRLQKSAVKLYEKTKTRYIAIFLDPEELIVSSSEELTRVIIYLMISEDQKLCQRIGIENHEGCLHAFARTLMKETEIFPGIGGLAPVRQQDDQSRSQVESGLRQLQGVMPASPEIYLNKLLEWACDRAYKFIIFIDEFEILQNNLHNDPDQRAITFLQYLRGISDNYHLAFVTASRRPLRLLTQEVGDSMSAGSPFDNNFSVKHRIGLLSADECERLAYDLPKRMLAGKDRGWVDRWTDFLRNHYNTIIAYTGRHPYYLKMGLASLWDMFFPQRKATHTDDTAIIEQWKNNFFSQAMYDFERIWDELEPKHRSALLSYSSKKKNWSDEATRTELEQRCLVEWVRSSKRPLRIYSGAFERYLRERNDGDRNDLERLEECIRDEKLLEKTARYKERAQQILENLRSLHSDETSLIRKASHITDILVAIDNFVSAVKEAEKRETNIPQDIESRLDDYQKAVDRSLKACLSFFERPDVFSGGENALSPYTGLCLLTQLVNFADVKGKQLRFSNGYDQLVFTRAQFLRIQFSRKDSAHTKAAGALSVVGIARDLPSTTTEMFGDAIERLRQSHDFGRLRELLEPTKPWFFIRLVTELFLRMPGLFAIGIFFLTMTAARMGQLIAGYLNAEKNDYSNLAELLLGDIAKTGPLSITIASLIGVVVVNLPLVLILLSRLYRKNVSDLIPVMGDDKDKVRRKIREWYRRSIIPLDIDLGGILTIISAVGVAMGGWWGMYGFLHRISSSSEIERIAVGVDLLSVFLAACAFLSVLHLYSKELVRKLRLPSVKVARSRAKYAMVTVLILASWLGWAAWYIFVFLLHAICCHPSPTDTVTMFFRHTQTVWQFCPVFLFACAATIAFVFLLVDQLSGPEMIASFDMKRRRERKTQ